MKMKNVIIVGVIALVMVNVIGKEGQNKEIERYKNENVLSEGEKLESKSNLILVNKDISLNKSYVPKNLVKADILFLDEATEEEKHMVEDAANAVEELIETAKREGIILIGSSAYRSYESQKQTYQRNVKSKGKKEADKYVAKPGKSEHQTGLAIDLTNEERWFDKSTKEAQWLEKNAHRFGFILRYPEGKEGITGYSYEPWHIRYVGKEVADEIYNRNRTLEEYLK